jgi:hypothetical protein
LHLDALPPSGPNDDRLGHPGSLQNVLPLEIFVMSSLTDSGVLIVRKLDATADIILQVRPKDFERGSNAAQHVELLATVYSV